MKKSIGKVVSMVLAAAMITSTFTATLSVSAATREYGTADLNDAKDEFWFASSGSKEYAGNLDDWFAVSANDTGVTLETYDHEIMSPSSADFVGFSHVSGDKVVQSIATKDGGSIGSINGVPSTNGGELKQGDVVLRANASGKEKISITYEMETTRDDKDIKVRGNVDVTIHADKVGSTVIGSAPSTFGLEKRPGTIDPLSVNDDEVNIAVYTVSADSNYYGSNRGAKYAAWSGNSTDIVMEAWKGTSKSFLKDGGWTAATDSSGNALSNKYQVVNGVITIPTAFVANSATDKVTLATVGSETIKITYPKDSDGTGSKTDSIKLTVAKQWTVPDGTNPEVNRKNGTTYVETNYGGGVGDWDDSDTWKDVNKNWDVAKVNGYKLLVKGGVTVLGGSIGSIESKNLGAVKVEDGTIGEIKAKGTIEVTGGSTGKLYGDATSIDVSNANVASIDGSKATVTIKSGKVGNVVGKTVEIDCDDEDLTTTVGNVTAKQNAEDTTSGNYSVIVDSSSDSAVKVGNILACGIQVSGNATTVGTLDANYYEDNGISFDDFSGTVANLKNTSECEVEVTGTSNVTLSSKLVADSVTIDADCSLSIPEGTLGTASGDGTLTVPAGKLFINDGMDTLTLKVTDLAVGATAFQSYKGAVNPDDVNLLGFTVDVKSVNSDVDKYVVKAVTFAGLNFDKSEANVAKGFETKISLSNYPAGTAMPTGAQVEWAIMADDDYFQMTVDPSGMTATVKVLDYDTSRADRNKAVVTATVVDENGYEYTDENYAVATCNVNGTALPSSTVTLDTKTVTVGTGNVYQFIAKSSTDAVMTAASSDAQIATVALYDSKDARGYKFQVNGVAEGKATITVTDANGAVGTMEVTVAKVNGTLKADVTSLKMAPGAIFDVKYTVTGSSAKPVVTCNGNVAKIADLGNGKYRITAVNPGTAWVVATVGNARVTVTVNVQAGTALSGVKGNNVSNL